jgi:hypothetical protein
MKEDAHLVMGLISTLHAAGDFATANPQPSQGAKAPFTGPEPTEIQNDLIRAME